MDFSWTKEQLDYKKKVTKFAQENFENNNIVKRDNDCSFSLDDWKKCANFGIQGLAAPLEYGGTKDKVDLLSATLTMEALGYGSKDNGLPLALNAQMWTVQQPITEFGTHFQKEKYLKAKWALH